MLRNRRAIVFNRVGNACVGGSIQPRFVHAKYFVMAKAPEAAPGAASANAVHPCEPALRGGRGGVVGVRAHLVEQVDGGREPAVHAKDLVVNESAEREAVKPAGPRGHR